ncbi:MAG: hypothetical protein IJ715_00280 [Bacilli bacterium]|nr:hypothetical protein [Bacilli bacterium]
MNKVDYFKKEYEMIKNSEYRDNLKKLVSMLPDYFFKVAASSTGKYHPSFTLGDAGLVRHSKAAFRIGYELLNNNTIGSVFNESEKELMLCGLLVHDGLKHGLVESKYTVFEHPILMANFLRENKDQFTWSDKEVNFIASVIETHMGEWTRDYQGNEVLTKPSNKYQKFVHMCDFLASRKFLDIKFDNNDIVE